MQWVEILYQSNYAITNNNNKKVILSRMLEFQEVSMHSTYKKEKIFFYFYLKLRNLKFLVRNWLSTLHKKKFFIEVFLCRSFHSSLYVFSKGCSFFFLSSFTIKFKKKFREANFSQKSKKSHQVYNFKWIISFSSWY